jgi:hypothetical protein
MQSTPMANYSVWRIKRWDRLNPAFCSLNPDGDRPSFRQSCYCQFLLLQIIYGFRAGRMLIERLD